MSAIAGLEVYLDDLAQGDAVPPFDFDSVTPREALPLVASYLARPGQMDRVERFESVFKYYLKAIFARGLTSADAKFVAEVSKSVGFVLKFKPYGIKCANALGYSIFFLWPGMGFSFQRHRTRKTELFHMLEIRERGQIYLSTSKEWDAVYEKDAFNRWLSGTPDPRFAAYSRQPEPGDVYLVTELDTVHSVLGCVLEEFATVSTDMVDRLHDQNTRGEVPLVPPETVQEWLAHLPRPLPGGCWSSLSEPPVGLATTRGEGSEKIVLADTGEFLAERFEIAAGASLALASEAERARSLFCLGGECRVTLTADGEQNGETLALAAGELIVVGPKVAATILAGAAASLSSHTILPALALD